MMLGGYTLISLIVNGTKMVTKCSSEESDICDATNKSSGASCINITSDEIETRRHDIKAENRTIGTKMNEKNVNLIFSGSEILKNHSCVTNKSNSTKTKIISNKDSTNPSNIVAINEKDDNQGKNHIKYMNSNINNAEDHHQVPYKSNNNCQDYQNRCNNNKIEKNSDMPKRNIDKYKQIADTNCNLSKNPNYSKKLYYVTKSHRLPNLNKPKQEMNMPAYNNNNKLIHNFQDKSSQNYVAKCNPTYPKSHESNNYANASYPHIFPNLPVNGLFYNQYAFLQPNLMKSNAVQQNVNILSENVVYYETIEDFLYINFLQFFPLLRNNFDSTLNMSSLYANINRVYPHLKLPNINVVYELDRNVYGFDDMKKNNRILDKQLFSLYTFYKPNSRYLNNYERIKIMELDQFVRKKNPFFLKYELYLTLQNHFLNVLNMCKKVP